MNSYLSIDLIIKQLLEQKDCVILPDFGGFIVRDSPATFIESQNMIKPATKSVFFNQTIKDNDGELIAAIQKNRSLDYDSAFLSYKQWYSELTNDLKLHNNYHLLNLGLFHQREDGAIWFESNPKVNFNIDSYGLFPVQAIKQEKAISHTKEIIFKPLADNKGIEKVRESAKLNYKKWLVAASIAAIAHISYLFFETPTPFNQASIVPSVSLETLTEKELPTVDFPEVQNEEIIVEETQPIEAVKENIEIQTPIIEEKSFETAPTIEQEINIENNKVVSVSKKAIAKYRFKINANFHAKDIENKGENAEVIEENNWFIVYQY